MIKGKISVIMGVYNCESTVIDAISAIQNQTYSNWELIICDDGSSDNTFNVIKGYIKSDDRCILIKNKVNRGLNYTLNRCLSKASGEYVARMDGDDLCDAMRFEKQIRTLSENEKYSIIGTEMLLFDENGVWGKANVPMYPSSENIIAGTAICHATILIKKDAIDSVGGYSEDPTTLRVEDVDLWIRLYEKGYRCINILEPLYHMRNDQNALNRRKYIYRINSTRTRLKGCYKLHLGVKSYIKALKPMINGLVPAGVRQYIRKTIKMKIK